MTAKYVDNKAKVTELLGQEWTPRCYVSNRPGVESFFLQEIYGVDDSTGFPILDGEPFRDLLMSLVVSANTPDRIHIQPQQVMELALMRPKNTHITHPGWYLDISKIIPSLLLKHIYGRATTNNAYSTARNKFETALRHWQRDVRTALERGRALSFGMILQIDGSPFILEISVPWDNKSTPWHTYITPKEIFVGREEELRSALSFLHDEPDYDPKKAAVRNLFESDATEVWWGEATNAHQILRGRFHDVEMITRTGLEYHLTRIIEQQILDLELNTRLHECREIQAYPFIITGHAVAEIEDPEPTVYIGETTLPVRDLGAQSRPSSFIKTETKDGGRWIQGESVYCEFGDMSIHLLPQMSYTSDRQRVFGCKGIQIMRTVTHPGTGRALNHYYTLEIDNPERSYRAKMMGRELWAKDRNKWALTLEDHQYMLRILEAAISSHETGSNEIIQQVVASAKKLIEGEITRMQES